MKILTQDEENRATQIVDVAKSVAQWYRKNSLVRAEHKKRPYRIPEFVFRIVYALVIIFTITLSIWDVRPDLRNHITLCECLLGLSCFVIVLIVVEMSTYQPRLFVLAEATSMQLFEELGKLSGEIASHCEQVRNRPPTSHSGLVESQEQLIRLAHAYCVIDKLRYKITRMVLFHFACMVFTLSMCGFFLSIITHDQFLRVLRWIPAFLAISILPQFYSLPLDLAM